MSRERQGTARTLRELTEMFVGRELATVGNHTWSSIHSNQIASTPERCWKASLTQA